MTGFFDILAVWTALGLLWNINRMLADIVRMMRERGRSGSGGI